MRDGLITQYDRGVEYGHDPEGVGLDVRELLLHDAELLLEDDPEDDEGRHEEHEDDVDGVDDEPEGEEGGPDALGADQEDDEGEHHEDDPRDHVGAVRNCGM